MSILKLTPATKDYLWGGTRLMRDFGKQTDGSILAEAWELSCHKDGNSTIAQGPYSGKTLAAYIAEAGQAVLGSNCERFVDFPILIKLIDSASPLSIQVHPSDEYARSHEGQNGKTEVWHIVDCGEDAYIYYGVNRSISREEYIAAIENGTVTDLLQKVPVKKGDAYFIEAGTIHAIGSDIVIAEIQQNSNVTYRVFDYNRRDAAGNLRELHVAKAVEVSCLKPNPPCYNFEGHLALCDYFCVDKLLLSGELRQEAGSDSFVSLLVTEGSGQVMLGGEQVEFVKGDSLFIPAASGSYTLCGEAVILKTTVPPADKPYRIGIDLGGTNIKVGIVDRGNRIVAKWSTKTLVERPWQDVVADMGHTALELLRQQGISLSQCSAVGVGSPGTVDAVAGVVAFSNNFAWDNFPLVAVLKKYIPLPMAITNDANAAALGEVVAGAAAGCKNAVLLTLGTGVGGGVILDGKVFEGGFAGGAELGHTSIVAGGELCTCGRRGCLESYASATALIRHAVEAAKACPQSRMNTLCGEELSRMDGKIPFDAAEAGDAAAIQVVEDYIGWLGEGITNMINIFRPEKVILSGGVCAQGEALTQPLNAYTKQFSFGGSKAFVAPVVTATLGNDAGIIGAASLTAGNQC
ncbi:MAG: type I phosphomannose isomerase catalytic subunit [Angelakisella sp.]